MFVGERYKWGVESAIKTESRSVKAAGSWTLDAVSQESNPLRIRCLHINCKPQFTNSEVTTFKFNLLRIWWPPSLMTPPDADASLIDIALPREHTIIGRATKRTSKAGNIWKKYTNAGKINAPTGSIHLSAFLHLILSKGKKKLQYQIMR